MKLRGDVKLSPVGKFWRLSDGHPLFFTRMTDAMTKFAECAGSLRGFAKRSSQDLRERLLFAAATLEQLDALRHKCLNGPFNQTQEAFSDSIGDDMMRILQISPETVDSDGN